LGNNPWAGNNSSIISSLLKKNSRTFKTLSVSKDFPGLDFFKQIQGLSRIFKDRGDPVNKFYFAANSLINPLSGIAPKVQYFIILLCLMPDTFTHQGASACAQLDFSQKRI
jgi:hypothetical protein